MRAQVGTIAEQLNEDSFEVRLNAEDYTYASLVIRADQLVRPHHRPTAPVPAIKRVSGGPGSASDARAVCMPRQANTLTGARNSPGAEDQLQRLG